MAARGLPRVPGYWLFRGRRPGRAAHPATLATRLRRLGLEPRTVRNSALLHLAEHLPAAVLADLLGLHLRTAEKWSTAAGSRWRDIRVGRAPRSGQVRGCRSGAHGAASGLQGQVPR